MALQKNWDVTYLDVRRPPVEINYVEGDATSMPFKDKTFDAVSTACVMTHAGLGRYGDAVVRDGDELMLKEIKRVLKLGAPAAITFGAVADMELPVIFSNVHRIYTIAEAKRLAELVGMKIEDMRIWGTAKKEWVDTPTHDFKEPDYLSALLRNVALT